MNVQVTMFAIEMELRKNCCAGIVAYLLVADLNTITKSTLQHLQAFGFRRELCIDDARG